MRVFVVMKDGYPAEVYDTQFEAQARCVRERAKGNHPVSPGSWCWYNFDLQMAGVDGHADDKLMPCDS